MYLRVEKGLNLKSSHHTQWQLCEVMDVLTNLFVVIILQYIRASNHHVVHLKRTVLYVNYISKKLGKKKTSMASCFLGHIGPTSLPITLAFPLGMALAALNACNPFLPPPPSELTGLSSLCSACFSGKLLWELGLRIIYLCVPYTIWNLDTEGAQ